MPHEMMIALKVIFGMFVVMISRIAWLMKKDKKEKGIYIENKLAVN